MDSLTKGLLVPPSTPAGYLSLALALIPLALVLTSLYNLFLHPLRSYPGPLLYRASPIPYALLIPSGRAPHAVHKLHEKYGPVVRIAPNHLSFTDARAWQDIYGLHAKPVAGTATTTSKKQRQQMIENPKAPIWYRSLNPDDPHDLLNAPPEKHAQLRKALSYGFADRALQAQETRIQHYIDLFINKLSERARDPKKRVVDMVGWFNWVVFDIMGDLVFAEPFGCLEKEKDHFFVELFGEMLLPGTALVSMGYLGLMWAVPLILRFVGGRKALVELKTELGRRVKGRIAKGEVVDDLFEGLLRHREEWGMSMTELEGTAHIVVTAGSETTPTLLAGATNLLLRNPDKLEKLKREIRTAFKSPEEITMASVNRLKYMLACLNESLRMFPPATHGMVREAAEGGLFVAGENWVPEGTLIECQIYSMNHSQANWNEPFSFQPERFLEGTKEGSAGEKTDNMKSLQPFQYGPRDCVGRNLAYAEMRLIIARLLFHFEMELVTDEEDKEDWASKQKAYFLWAKTPLKVRVRPREN